MSEPARMADFWAGALGLRAERLDTGAYRLVDEVAEHTVWLNQVPEPYRVKQRVHLDVGVGSVDELVDRGATVIDVQPRWTVLRDPEGGELCAFVRPPERLGRYRLTETVVDAVDPAAIARWWGERWGTEPRRGDDGTFWWLEPAAGLPVAWCFQVVPEPRRVKNRVHWDVVGSTAELLAVGATLLRSSSDGPDWDVLADPEGNEFCVFPSR